MVEKAPVAVPDIPQDMKEQLKKERLVQYRARIFNIQMDMVAYESVGDMNRLAMSKKNLDDTITSYYAVEGM